MSLSNSAVAASHQHAIQQLAAELKLPMELVSASYLSELDVLSQDARVDDYLALFATRRTRKALLTTPGKQ
jgi:hypothetical protein